MILFNKYSFRYNAHREWALEGLDLEIETGSFSVIAGKSGSGKSTLLKAIAGIIPNYTKGITKGCNSTMGMDVAKNSLSAITKKVGILFQNADAQFFNLSVEDEICFGMLNRGWDKQKISARLQEMLHFFYLSEVRHLPCQALSEGQKQKTVLASIMAVNPTLLLLDEPLAHLDNQQVNDLLNELVRLKNQGLTIIIAEHRLDKLSGIADRVIVLKNGKIKVDKPAAWLNDNAMRIKFGLREKKSIDKEDKTYVLPDRNIITGIKNGIIRYNSGFEKKIENFVVSQNNKIIIKGPNGSGKTSILKVLSGLKKLSSGLTIPGKIKPGKLSSLAFQQTDNQLFMESVEDEVITFANNKDYAETIIRAFGLEEFRKLNPFCLSDGQKQRVVLASVFSRQVPVILLDEPTTGMDGEQLKQFVKMFGNVSSNQQACIMATHDEDLINQLSYSVYNMN